MSVYTCCHVIIQDKEQLVSQIINFKLFMITAAILQPD